MDISPSTDLFENLVCRKSHLRFPISNPGFLRFKILVSGAPKIRDVQHSGFHVLDG